jgi:hypothetical protein
MVSQFLITSCYRSQLFLRTAVESRFRRMERTGLKRHDQTLGDEIYTADQKVELRLIQIDRHSICIIDFKELV